MLLSATCPPASCHLQLLWGTVINGCGPACNNWDVLEVRGLEQSGHMTYYNDYVQANNFNNYCGYIKKFYSLFIIMQY